MSGILPTIVFPSDILAEQARLLEALNGTNASVAACNLDAPTKTAWQLFFDTASGFAKEDPGFWGSTGARMDRVQSYEQELLAWQTKLSAAGCKLGLPLFNANPPPNTQIVQYAALAIGAVAGAYVIGQLLAFVPRPRR